MIDDLLRHMPNDLIQIHDGIGMTDELDAVLHSNRVTTLEAIHGNQTLHCDLHATLWGI